MKQQLGEIQKVRTHGVRKDQAELSEKSYLVRAHQI